VTEQIVMRPQSLTVAQVSTEENAEVRRVMIERMGFARYIRESGAKLIHTDKRGKLWRADRPNDTPIVMVEVRNSTAEPDGSIKDYFLRVPPDTKTATAAVAWTFGMKSTDWRPGVES
jgi:hypothetical protein